MEEITTKTRTYNDEQQKIMIENNMEITVKITRKI